MGKLAGWAEAHHHVCSTSTRQASQGAAGGVAGPGAPFSKFVFGRQDLDAARGHREREGGSLRSVQHVIETCRERWLRVWRPAKAVPVRGVLPRCGASKGSVGTRHISSHEAHQEPDQSVETPHTTDCHGTGYLRPAGLHPPYTIPAAPTLPDPETPPTTAATRASPRMSEAAAAQSVSRGASHKAPHASSPEQTQKLRSYTTYVKHCAVGDPGPTFLCKRRRAMCYARDGNGKRVDAIPDNNQQRGTAGTSTFGGS